MDRDYMLSMVHQRLNELERRYIIYAGGKGLKGEVLSKGTAALKRKDVKRDILILTLVQELLTNSTTAYVESDDAVAGFERLVEPKERVF